MRFVAVVVMILMAGVANAESFKCQAGPYWSSGDDVVVRLTINDDGVTGTVKVAGVTHEADYAVEGFNRKWSFGEATESGLYRYQFILEPSGRAYYYDFTGADVGETVSSKQIFFCK
jgi:hypothetical protein